MTINIVTYGIKHRKPGSVKANWDFPCTSLANPHSRPELRNDTGVDKFVQAFVFHKSGDKAYNIFEAARMLINGVGLDEEVTIAFHCYGGRHRSVAVAERVARMSDTTGHQINLKHMELNTK